AGGPAGQRTVPAVRTARTSRPWRTAPSAAKSGAAAMRARVLSPAAALAGTAARASAGMASMDAAARPADCRKLRRSGMDRSSSGVGAEYGQGRRRATIASFREQPLAVLVAPCRFPALPWSAPALQTCTDAGAATGPGHRAGPAAVASAVHFTSVRDATPAAPAQRAACLRGRRPPPEPDPRRAGAVREPGRAEPPDPYPRAAPGRGPVPPPAARGGADRGGRGAVPGAAGRVRPHRRG